MLCKVRQMKKKTLNPKSTWTLSKLWRLLPKLMIMWAKNTSKLVSQGYQQTTCELVSRGYKELVSQGYKQTIRWTLVLDKEVTISWYTTCEHCEYIDLWNNQTNSRRLKQFIKNLFLCITAFIDANVLMMVKIWVKYGMLKKYGNKNMASKNMV